MADWESFAGVVLAVVALITWTSWYSDILHVRRLASPRIDGLLLGFTPLVCLIFLLGSLMTLAAPSVRESGYYIFIYMAIGAAVLGVSGRLYALFGVSARDDVLERRNRAGVVAIVGALLGTTLCIAGGNVGEGPDVGVVIVAAGTALIVWFVLWYLAELLSGRVIAERVTVERDLGSAVRLAGLLTGNGIILGAAAAGDWVPKRFIHDFVVSAWPALVVTIGAVFVERVTKARSWLGRSVFTLFGILLVAVAWVLHHGVRT